jgi:hypothetical protein
LLNASFSSFARLERAEFFRAVRVFVLFLAAERLKSLVMKTPTATVRGVGPAVLAFAVSVFLFPQPLGAHLSSGGNAQNFSTIDIGGAVATSGDASVRNVGFLGVPGTVAASHDEEVVARQGGVSWVFAPTKLLVTSADNQINEAGASPASSTQTQLGGRLTMDDLTVTVLPGGELTWDAPAPATGLASISPDGVAQAATVYQNTIGLFTGHAAGFSDTSFVTVLNVLPDNYEQWAGDTFDDAWQIAEGMPGAVNPNALNAGIPYWQLYAMGLNPLAPISGPLTGVDISLDGYLTITWTRNPYATNYVFRVQETTNLTNAFATLINPVSVTNSSTPQIEAITTRASAPRVNFNRQFLRVFIEEP